MAVVGEGQLLLVDRRPARGHGGLILLAEEVREVPVHEVVVGLADDGGLLGPVQALEPRVARQIHPSRVLEPDQVREGGNEGLEQAALPCQRLLHPSVSGPVAQCPDPEGQVLGELAQQTHLVGIEGIRLARIRGQCPGARAVVDQDRQRDRRGIAALQGRLAPGGESGVGCELTAADGVALADSGAGGAMPQRVVGPGDADGLQITVIEARLSYGSDGLCCVLLGNPHPGHAIAADVDQQPADVIQELLLVGRADQGLAARAQGAQGAVGPPQGILGLSALGDVPRDAEQPDDASIGVVQGSFGGQIGPVALGRRQRLFDGAGLVRRHHGPVFLDQPGRLLGREQRLLAAAQHLRGALAGHARRGSVAEHESPPGVQCKDSVGGALGDRVQQLQRLQPLGLDPALAQRRGQLPALAQHHRTAAHRQQHQQPGQRQPDYILGCISVDLGPIDLGDEKPVRARDRPGHAQRGDAPVVHPLNRAGQVDPLAQHLGGQQPRLGDRQPQLHRSVRAVAQPVEKQHLIAVSPEHQGLAAGARDRPGAQQWEQVRRRIDSQHHHRSRHLVLASQRGDEIDPKPPGWVAVGPDPAYPVIGGCLASGGDQGGTDRGAVAPGVPDELSPPVHEQDIEEPLRFPILVETIA